MFFGDWASGGWPGGPGDPEPTPQPALQPDEAALIRALRRLALAGPTVRCPMTELALLQQFGGQGSEMAAVLRCLVMALAAGALRPLRLATGCGPLTADERLLLAAMRGPAPDAERRLALLLAPAQAHTAARLCGLLARLKAAA